MAYTWQKLANDWDALSDTDKIALFEGTEHKIPTASDLESIGEPFQIAIYDSIESGQKLIIEGIPNRQIVIPTELIETSKFNHISKIFFDFNISGDVNIKVAITTDLVNYYVYDETNEVWNLIDINNIDTDGMSLLEINSYTAEVWDLLDLSGGIGIAYSLDISADTDIAEIDTLKFTGETVGTWTSQVKGDVFDYEYVVDNTLRVYIYDNGNYKINYKKKNTDGGGGSGEIATKEEIDELFA